MDVVTLTQKLVGLNTINPPGNEKVAIELCAEILSEAGFTCETSNSPHGARANLVATRGTGDGAAIGFSAHLDTVPFGSAQWVHHPLLAEIVDGRLFGRGASDMKGAVAAVLCACCEPYTPPGGIAVILTFGEETGCDGARQLATDGNLPKIGALVVPESTNNNLVHGHKGVLWLTISFKGKTAHGAMPDRGINAIDLAVDALVKIRQIDLGDDHSIMGSSTLNIGTIQGGMNTNSVPDLCEVTLDIRTLPGAKHENIARQISLLSGPSSTITVLLDLAPVWTDPNDIWVRDTADLLGNMNASISPPASVDYFTDASILGPALKFPPVLILGPGNPTQVHCTDEWINLDNLHDAEKIFTKIIQNWRRN